MAVPKRKMSRSNTRARRSQWKAAVPDLVPIKVDGETKLVPRKLIKHFHRLEK
jgi:large subunit ribosomal protein L32